VAILVRPHEHYSLLLYRDALRRRLPQYGIDLREFEPGADIPPDCDILWDPGLGMRKVPDILLDAKIPVVATVLGLRSFATSIETMPVDENELAAERALKSEVQAGWQGLHRTLAAAIAISNSCANDLISGLGVPRALVHTIYLAVDRTVFTPRSPILRVPRDYLFHVSLVGSSRKNFARMLAAYEQLSPGLRIPFLIKYQGDPSSLSLPAGVRVLPGHCPDAELAQYYRGARCLLFPSIYEGFGLPILEAMSCGCPVITSISTACSEIAGGAALLVDPLSTESIATAMGEILRDDDLALDLAAKGIRRAGQFDWDKAAVEHAHLFRAITQPAGLHRDRHAL
jgi:glycosyltransferase involved in cell wall biosynthesis